MPLEPFDFGKYQEDQDMRDTLPYSDPLHPRGFFRDRQIGGWELWWGGYQYWIEDDRMKDERDLLRWLEHLGRKDWPGMTTPRAARFITAVLDHLGKSLYPSLYGENGAVRPVKAPPQPETPSQATGLQIHHIASDGQIEGE